MGVEGRRKRGGGWLNEGGESASFLVVHETNLGDLNARETVAQTERAAECSGGPRCTASQRGKPTAKMLNCGRRAPDRLLSSLAMWPQWAGGGAFSIPLPLPATQKGNVLQTSGKQWRAACTWGFSKPLQKNKNQRVSEWVSPAFTLVAGQMHVSYIVLKPEWNIIYMSVELCWLKEQRGVFDHIVVILHIWSHVFTSKLLRCSCTIRTMHILQMLHEKEAFVNMFVRSQGCTIGYGEKLHLIYILSVQHYHYVTQNYWLGMYLLDHISSYAHLATHPRKCKLIN